MPILSRLETCPQEILEAVSLWLVGMSFLGPPSDIITMLTLSKNILRKLCPKYNQHFYARIFRIKFDVGAATRRFGGECGSVARLAQELIRRCESLKRIRNLLYPNLGSALLPQGDGLLRADLWTAYLMFIESDGHNARQLVDYARIGQLVVSLISPVGRFHDGTDGNGGWAVDDEINALTGWLFWFTDKDRVHSETQAERRAILRTFAHFFIGSFKYACAYAPITSFLIPPLTPPPRPAVGTAFPLAASPILPPCRVFNHFGLDIVLARPLLTHAAFLICTVRFEASASEVILPPLPNIPTTRAEADTMGTIGPTRDDYLEQQRPTTLPIEWMRNSNAGSMMFDYDWMRLSTGYNPWDRSSSRANVLVPGMLHGQWTGQWFGFSRDLEPFFSPEEVVHHPVRLSPIPMQFHLREYLQHQLNDVATFNDISCDGSGAGVFNAWLPTAPMAETDQGLRFSDPTARRPSTYRAYSPTAAAQAALDAEVLSTSQDATPYGDAVCDIVVMAETDPSFGRAWGPHRYHGRVRSWDGLVVLVRDADDREEEWIFRGYLHAGRNLVGRWRETRTPVDMPGWEGVWCMTRVEG